MELFKRHYKKFKKSPFIQRLTQYVLYMILRSLFATYKLNISYHSSLTLPLIKQHGVYYFWHQSIISGMFFFSKLKIKGSCIASPSSDGKIAGFICEKLGFNVIYGSSTKNSLSLIRQAQASLQITKQLCLIGDGSRGPAFTLQKGVSYLAKKTNLPIIFIECTPSKAYTCKKSWDRFQIPLPFSTINIFVHPPVWVD